MICLSIQEIILDIMEQEGITKNELAKRLGISRQAVSQMLSQDDMKMSTVVTILFELGYVFNIEKVGVSNE